LLQQCREGPLRQATGRRVGDLLQGKQINVESRSGIAERAAGDNFPPLGRQITYILEFLGCELGSGHRLSCLVLAFRNGDVLAQLFYRRVLQLAKQVLASGLRHRTTCPWLPSHVGAMLE
jgi:hypothetical protein